jgi:ribose 5-phosphate isomerase B
VVFYVKIIYRSRSGGGLQLKIAIGSDHAAFDYKEEVKKFLISGGHTIKDFGIYEEIPIKDYSVAEKVALSVSDGKSDRGVLLCGTGIGMSISANKIPGSIAALCHDHFTAKCAREHNNSNILVLGSRVISLELALEIINIWLMTEYQGGRHILRNKSFLEFDQKYRKV